MGNMTAPAKEKKEWRLEYILSSSLSSGFDLVAGENEDYAHCGFCFLRMTDVKDLRGILARNKRTRTL